MGREAEGRSPHRERRYIDPRDGGTTEVSREIRPIQVSMARRVVLRAPDRSYAQRSDRVDVSPAQLSRLEG